MITSLTAIFECRKTKTKVTTLINHRRRRHSNEPISQSNQIQIAGAKQENACRQVTIGFGFTSDWLREWPITKRIAVQNQSNCEITFDTQLKPALM